MISEGIQKFVDLVIGGTRVVGLGNDGPRHRLFDVDGKIERRETVPSARSHSVNTFKSLVDVVNRFSEDGPSTVWVSSGGIVVVLDDGTGCVDKPADHRIDRVSMNLTKNPLFNVLGKMQPFDHKSLIYLLDHTFADAVIPDGFLTAVRAVKWSSTDEEESELQTTRNSMGRKVQSEVEGTGKLDDRLSIEFKPYPALDGELDTVVVVECSFYAISEDRKFDLQPLPGQLERAEVSATMAVAALVREKFGKDGPLVICGSP